MSALPDSVQGALLALLGVLAAQLVAMLQARLDRAHKRDVLLREKYEELAGHLNDSLVWVMESLRAHTFSELASHAQPLAARKAYTLCLLYFPLLRQHAEHYVDACVSFHNVLTETFVPNPELDAGGQAERNIAPKFRVIGEHLREARITFDEQIKAHAREYIKA